MFHVDTLFDNEECFDLPEVEERDLSASLTLRWSRKRKRWECRNAFFWQDAKNKWSCRSQDGRARTADIIMASAACVPC